ncbi:MAG: A/G-specific adenine glycosylase [Anaerolineaceae bacterium]|nr:MAG: A/G-specific adenine glycosylase [Anaerolineaceae bacterium]
MPSLSNKLLRWYARHARDLPWRGHPDPYAVWVSEIMLQQTRVEAVVPYFARWMERFPSIPDLAAASEQEALLLWEGLGYYSRARSLHKAAKIVVEKFGGELPRDLPGLRALPGIGRYTAGAIASIAFGVDAAALDGNIRRVLARLFDVAVPADAPAGEKILWSLAEELLPPGRAGDFNQALMDLGASLCLPKNPRCLLCPLNADCLALQRGVQEQRPVLKPKSQTPHHTVTAAVIRRGDKILLAQRPADGLLGGLWEFPGGKTEPGESLAECLRREIREELGARIRVSEPFGVYRHAYTHFRITLHAFLCELTSGEPRPLQAAAVAWVSVSELADYPMGKVDRQIARKMCQ